MKNKEHKRAEKLIQFCLKIFYLTLILSRPHPGASMFLKLTFLIQISWVQNPFSHILMFAAPNNKWANKQVPYSKWKWLYIDQNYESIKIVRVTFVMEVCQHTEKQQNLLSMTCCSDAEESWFQMRCCCRASSDPILPNPWEYTVCSYLYWASRI